MNAILVDLAMLMVVLLIIELETLLAIFHILAPSRRSHLLEAIIDMAIPPGLLESI